MKKIIKIMTLTAMASILSGCKIGDVTVSESKLPESSSVISNSSNNSSQSVSSPASSANSSKESSKSSSLNNPAGSSNSASSSKPSSSASSSKPSSNSSSKPSSNSSSKPSSSSSTASVSSWKDAYTADGYVAATSFPKDLIQDFCYESTFDLSWVGEPNDLVYGFYEETDESYAYIDVVLAGDFFDDMYYAAEDLGCDFIDSYFYYYVLDEERNYMCMVYSFEGDNEDVYTDLIFYAGFDVFSFDTDTGTSWDSSTNDVFDDYLDGHALPFMQFGEEYMWDIEEDEDDPDLYYVTMWDYYAYDLTEDYYDVLEDSGFTYIPFDEDTWEGDEFVKEYDDGCVVTVYAYWDYYGNNIYATIEGNTSIGGSTGTLENPASSPMSFANDNFLKVEDADESVWETEFFKFTISKGSSSTDVGNSTYFSNPLRTYSGQEYTITWKTILAPERIVFDVDQSVISKGSPKSVPSAITTSVTGATVTLDGTTVTYTLNSGVSSVKTVVEGGQCHLSSITLYW